MKDAPAPRLHLFVCANRREGSPLGPGCGERGDAVYDALKQAVTARGEVASTWITKTHCLGICPREGATVARYRGATASSASSESSIVTEVKVEDVPTLLAAAHRQADVENADDATFAELMHEVGLLEELQRKKVLDLARRLKPGLTLEDVQNPHDFPELDDPDWHYADGVLAGVASVKSAAQAHLRKKER